MKYYYTRKRLLWEFKLQVPQDSDCCVMVDPVIKKSGGLGYFFSYLHKSCTKLTKFCDKRGGPPPEFSRFDANCGGSLVCLLFCFPYLHFFFTFNSILFLFIRLAIYLGFFYVSELMTHFDAAIFFCLS